MIRIAELKKSYYAIIPAEVRYDEELPPNAKLLYGEITSLCNEKGYCWATNQYFADLYKVSKIAVSRWISTLCKKGYIAVETLYKKGTKKIIERHLYIVNTPINKNVNRYMQNDLEGINEIVNTSINKNVKDNNKVINTKINNKLEVSKHKYGEYQHVLLTDKEHTHLLDLYGDSLDEHIKILDEYIETSGKKYKNHSLVIQKWVHDEWMKRNKDKPITLDSKFYADKSTKTDKEVQDEFNRLRAQLFGAYEVD